MRLPGPRVLLAAGLTLLVVSVGSVLLLGHGHSHSPVTTATTATTATTTTTAPTPPPPPSTPQVSAVGAYSATVTWRSDTPSTGHVVWGPAGKRAFLWASDAAPTTDHSLTLDGLTSSTPYVAQVGTTTLPFTTGPAPSAVTGAVSDGVVRVNGASFFPFVTWEECPDRWDPDIADGIDLFAGNPCTGLPSLLTAVQGHALATGTTDDTPGTTGPGLLGWFYPDEADGRGLTAATLPPPGAGLRFLTVTSHFYSGAAPLPTGRGMYPDLFAQADVIGFDIYPLQELCRPDFLPAVFDSQKELVAMAPGKPTFQWIEVRVMKCPDAASAVTPATIRVESWFAIAGGAHGLGFFPPDWGVGIGSVIRSVTDRVRRLEPALLQPALPVTMSPDAPAVRASARELGGAVYVIAVNAGSSSATVQLTEPSIGNRTLAVVGSRQTVQAQNGTFTATLPPLSVQIYVAAPTM